MALRISLTLPLAVALATVSSTRAMAQTAPSPEAETPPGPAPQPPPADTTIPRPVPATPAPHFEGSMPPPPARPEPVAEEPPPASSASVSADASASTEELQWGAGGAARTEDDEDDPEPPGRRDHRRRRAARPLILDVGVGPAVGIGYNKAEYESVLTPVDETNPPRWRVVRTEQGLNLDVIVSISAYLWKPRTVDDPVFDAWQLIPRPMVGISLDRPFDVLYAGLQLDPIQYVNIAGGLRVANDPELVGPQLLDPALRNADGEAQPPITREEVKFSGFVALTVSTNLILRWLQH